MQTFLSFIKQIRRNNKLNRSTRRPFRLESLEPRVLLDAGGIDVLENALTSAGQLAIDDDLTPTFTSTNRGDSYRVGSGNQLVDGGAGRDRFVSYGDAGEPDPAQTDGATGRVNARLADGLADDTFIGGPGADTFEFIPLINATQEVLDQYRSQNSGQVNWRRVAGENDNVHDHWVEGVGKDTIADFSREEGDRIKVTGHTVSLAGIEYGEDEGGAFSLIILDSDQGANGGAHDGDALGTIKVYGDRVTADDVQVNAGVFYGMERLAEADRLANYNGGGTREVISATDGYSYTGEARVRDLVTLGRGSQTIDAGAGNDYILLRGDAGEPDPAQTDGATGRVNAAVDPSLADDTVRGGQGRDLFRFRPLINAKAEIIAKHTRDNGTVNWRRVAGENDNVHDHWVEGVGNDTILDFDKGDRDRIRIEGHTVSLDSIEYGEDKGGAYSLLTLSSDQGANGGAHDGDSLGTIKVYGDRVTDEDVTVKAGVFYGIDRLDAVDANDNSGDYSAGPQPVASSSNSVNANTGGETFVGTSHRDKFRTGSGNQVVDGGAGRDRILSFGDAGEPDPAQTDGATGRVNARLADGQADDIFIGGSGADTFEFIPLINATQEVLDQYRSHNSGRINWRRVAGENDNVHDHWVEGIGNDTIMDFSREEGDRIKVTGHTASLAGIDYGEDKGGAFSLIILESDQGANGGAHDGDTLGTIKVYGDRVAADDVEVNAGVFYGMERLAEADRLADHNGGGTREIISATDGYSYTGEARVRDLAKLGRGSQTIDGGAGNDRILLLGDAGEPDPAQTDGATGRVNAAVDPSLADDTVRGGQGKDVFRFRALINAKAEIIAKHTRDNGTVNWRRVAGENDNVHDHWVEGVGNDTILDFDKGDGDKIRIEGHTVSLDSIEYGEDKGGAYSLLKLSSDQGANGGAHDGDSLGTIKVYGDRVTAEDVTVRAGVFYGIDQLDAVDANDNSKETAIT